MMMGLMKLLENIQIIMDYKKIQTEFKNYMRERIPAVKFLFITMVKRLR